MFHTSNSTPNVNSLSGSPKDVKRTTTAGTDASNVGVVTESTQSSVEIEHAVISTAVKDPTTNTKSSTLYTKPRLDMFNQNINPPSARVPVPEIRTRIDTTPQLALCIGLLNKYSHTVDTVDLQKNPPQDLNPGSTARLAWIEAVKHDPVEQDHIRWLGIRMVEEFAKSIYKDSKEIAEMVLLGPVLDNKTYRRLLECTISAFANAATLDIDLLQGVVQLIQCSPPESLLSDDLVKILRILRVRLQDTHQQSSVYPFHLTLAISRVLDIMADHKVKDLNRVVEHEPLSGVLSGLKESSDPYLMYQACYAFQALQYVPDDETALEGVLRHSGCVVDGLVKTSAVFKLDIGAVLKGLGSLQEVLVGAIGTAITVYEGVSSLLESGRGVVESLKEGVGCGQKRPWYSAIRAANAFAQAGQLKDLHRLIYEAPCRRDPLFQWGICQLLGEIASDSMWDTSVRRQAVDLLGELYKNDREWGQDESVKTWMVNIISQLGSVEDEVVKTTAYTLLQELMEDRGAASSLPYPLRNRLPPPTTSPILARVQNVPYVEYDLHKLRLQRLEEHRKGVYIPPQAKPSLQATDDTLFPLMEKVQEFLTGRRQVFLVLGDSGAGKSTFNLELEYALWKDYKKQGPIPLYINLPTIDEPAQGLIEKQLKYHNFSCDKIQEMKQHREFILICDGYDESQLKINLHSSNWFNQPGQWKVKMVISCRSQYLGQDYRLRFQPQPTDRYQQSTAHLFQEAVMAAFSRAQIRQYVEEYVKELPAVNPLQNQPSWAAEEYMDKLVNIPHLMELVSNPFLLTLALDALPSVVGSKKDLSAIRITRVQLYDSFVKRWLEVNRLRLEQSPLSATERSELDSLIDDNFLYHGIRFQKDLSTAIFTVHDRNPVVKYIPLREKHTWKGAFFAAEGQAKLLRESSTVVRTGAFFRFLHRSLLEYFYSRTVYEPHDYDEDATTVDRESPCDSKTCLAQLSIVNESSIVQFLAERVRQDPIFQQQLLEAIEESKTHASASIAATNAITILIRADVPFNGANLRDIKVPGADLSNGQFDFAQFQGADLRGVNFSKCWLRQANMSDTQIEGVRFGELPYLEMDTEVYYCTYSPNGKIFGSTLNNGTIHIYDTSAWTRMHNLEGHTKAVWDIAFSPDSQRLVSGSNDNTIRLWDTTNGEELLIMEGHSDSIRSVAFSPCGHRILSAGVDKTLRLWDTHTGETLFVLERHISQVMRAKFSPNGLQLVSGSWDGTIQLWNAETGEPEVDLTPSEDLNRVEYSLDGRWIATGYDQGHLQLWDAASLEPGLAFSGHTDAVTDIVFSPNGQWVASSSADSTVRLWDASTGDPVSVLTSLSTVVNCVAFSPDGHQLASGGDDRKVRLWELGSGWSSLDPRDGGRIVQLTYSRDGQSILSYDEDGIFLRWDATTGASAPILFEMPEQEAITCREYALDGSQIALGYIDGSIRLWNCQTETAGPVLEGRSRRIRMLIYSPCCRWIISVVSSCTVRLWDLHNVELQYHPVDVDENLYMPVRTLAFSPMGDQFAVGTDEGIVYLFDTQSKERLARMKLEGRIMSLIYSPNEQQIAIGTTKGRIHLCDLQSKELSAVLEGHVGDVRSIEYSPCGQWIASGSYDKTVGIWHRRLEGEAESWSKEHSICAFFGKVENIAWNPVAPMEFVTCCSDGSVQLWKMSINESEKIVTKMIWGSNLGILCIEGAVFTRTLGLSPIYQKLLVQRGATCPSNESTFPRA